jgi:putative ABC transport system permease protein
MTLTRFVTKNAFRNKRRTILTVVSISVSLLLLTLMMTVWRAFYIDKGAPESALRLIARHRVSLTNMMPLAYENKIRALPGIARSPMGGMFRQAQVNVPTALVALAVAALVGFMSAFLPSYRAAKLNIADGLRHLG